jgi:hypothetical protein
LGVPHIPVIFFGDPDDYRTSIIEELGLDIHKIPHQKTTRDSKGKEWENTFNSINWTSDPIDIHIEKDKIEHDESVTQWDDYNCDLPAG